MRVLCVTPMYPEPDNPVFGCFVQRLNDALASLGVEVQLARRPPGARGVMSYGRLLASALATAPTTFDLVHAHYLGPAVAIAVAAAWRAHKPLLATIHGSDVEAARSTTRRWALVRLLRACDGLHVVSAALEKRAQALLGALPKHRLVQPLGIDVSSLAAVAPQSGGFALLCVGRLSPEKGWDDALAALAVLVRAGHPAHLVACGDGDRAWFWRLARHHGVADRVELCGFVPPSVMPAFYARADVVLVPSLREGFGLVGLEAMAAGVPVVSTGVGGLSDYMRHEENALLVPPASGAKLAEAVIRLTVEPSLRARLQTAGRKRAAGFSVIEAARRLASFYEEVAGRHREVRP